MVKPGRAEWVVRVVEGATEATEPYVTVRSAMVATPVTEATALRGATVEMEAPGEPAEMEDLSLSRCPTTAPGSRSSRIRGEPVAWAEVVDLVGWAETPERLAAEERPEPVVARPARTEARILADRQAGLEPLGLPAARADLA